MKTIKLAAIFIFLGSFPSGVFAQTPAWETDPFVIDQLLALSGPTSPIILHDVVIFSASSSLRRAGVAFAHENFARVHWFRQLLVPAYLPTPEPDAPPNPVGGTEDSGILFHVLEIPDGLAEIEYRIITDGLWSADPSNPLVRRDPRSGLMMSVLSLAQRPQAHNVLGGPAGTVSFLFTGPPGEVVTVAGSFNGWDPFMFRLTEGPAGVFRLTLPMPPGTYQYAFFRRGQRYLDEYNHARAYAPDGRAVSVIVVP